MRGAGRVPAALLLIGTIHTGVEVSLSVPVSAGATASRSVGA